MKTKSLKGQLKCPQCETILEEVEISLSLDKKRAKIAKGGTVPQDLTVLVTTRYECPIDGTVVQLPEKLNYTMVE